MTVLCPASDLTNIPLARQWYQGQELMTPTACAEVGLDSHTRCSGGAAVTMNINFFAVPQTARSQGMSLQ